MTDWPNIEKPLCDHLAANTTFGWTIEGGHDVGSRVPLGIVQRAGGTHDLDLEDAPNVEVTLIGGSRDGLWAMAHQVNRVLAGLNPGGIGDVIWVDEVGATFGWTVDPDRGSSTYRVATATFSLVLRPQAESN